MHAAAHVDVVDLAEEGQRLVDAELAGARHERADVLGQAAAAEAEAGVEELAADAVVVADGVGELLDVGAGRLAHLRHRVDEGDLGGQEGVGRDLDQLGGGEVGDDHRSAGVPAPWRRPRAAAARRPSDRTPKTSRSGRSVSSTAKPSRRNSGFQASSTSLAGRRGSVQPVREPGGRADGDGGLADDERGPVQVRGEPVDDRVDVGQVGGVLALLLRGAHADEVHVAERRGLGVRRGEPQPARLHVLAQQRLEAGLEERNPPLGRGRRSCPRRRPCRGPRSRARPCTRRGWRRGSRCRAR